MTNLLSNLPKIVKKRKKRVGRGYGSGIGAKSGRGMTRHQAARENIPIHFEGGQNRLVKGMPLLRGKGKNKSIVNKKNRVRYTKKLDLFALDLNSCCLIFFWRLFNWIIRWRYHKSSLSSCHLGHIGYHYNNI